MTDRQPNPPRFSLLTLLLVTAIVALSFGIYRAWENEHLAELEFGEARVMLDLSEREVQRLRRRVADREDRDPSKLHAVLLRYPLASPGMDWPMQWVWYVSIPEARQYSVHLATAEDLPSRSPLAAPPKSPGPALFELTAGKHEIQFLSFRHSGTGKWVHRLIAPDNSLAWEAEPAIPWGEHRVFPGKSDANGDPDKPFVVGRCEVHANGGRIDGLMIWLEPKPAGAAAETPAP